MFNSSNCKYRKERRKQFSNEPANFNKWLWKFVYDHPCTNGIAQFTSLPSQASRVPLWIGHCHFFSEGHLKLRHIPFNHVIISFVLYHESHIDLLKEKNFIVQNIFYLVILPVVLQRILKWALSASERVRKLKITKSPPTYINC